MLEIDIKDPKFRRFAVSKTIDSVEELATSKEMSIVFYNYARAKTRTIDTINRIGGHIKTHVVNVDPKTNYGKGVKLYREYITDNMRTIREITPSSMMSNNDFRIVLKDGDDLVFTTYLIKRHILDIPKILEENDLYVTW